MDCLNYEKTGSLALGIGVHHDAAVALCDPQGIICAIQEERVSRIKHHYGFPYRALATMFEYTGVSPEEVDLVAFGRRTPLYPRHDANIVVDLDGVAVGAEPPAEQGDSQYVPAGLSRDELLAWLRPTWGEFADRHWAFAEEYLRDLGLLDAGLKHYYIAHHLAHAASAFRLSGLEDACVITVDGKGDGSSATVYRGSADGRLRLLRRSTARNSLGSFYQAATEALGFVPVDGEYKTMGLAALGNPDGHSNPFEGTVRVDNGKFRSTFSWSFRRFNDVYPDRAVPNPLGSVAQADELAEQLQFHSRERFAYFVQEHCERNLLEYVRTALRLADCKNLIGAGGVMLNVKANTLIEESLTPDSFFVFPDSADAGLAAGAAMEALYQEGQHRHTARFGNPYLGHGFTAEEIETSISRCRQENGVTATRATPADVARRLAEGIVVGSFQGRLEVGPRALGNRSVLADPRSERVKDRINGLLKGREPFVPFAPILLESEAPKYWSGTVEHRYMTFAVQASDYARQAVPAVVHVDGTMRPQVVSAEWNPWIAAVLREFKELTGEGLLVNTSFNRHGQPIVGSPLDALDHLTNGWVEGLAIGDWYVSPDGAAPIEERG